MIKIVKIGKISQNEVDALNSIGNFDIIETESFYSKELYNILQQIWGGGNLELVVFNFDFIIQNESLKK